MRVAAISAFLLALAWIGGPPAAVGATSSTAPPVLLTTISLGTNRFASFLAVNAATHRLYVADAGTFALYVIDTTANTVVGTLPLNFQPVGLALDQVTNKVFVLESNCPPIIPLVGGSAAGLPAATSMLGAAVEVDGTTLAIIGQAATGLGPAAIAVNPVTSRVYVTNSGCNVNSPPYFIPDASVTVINALTRVPVARIKQIAGVPITVDPSLNRIYAAAFGGSVAVIDGVTNTVLTRVQTSVGAVAMATNPLTHAVFVGMTESAASVIDGTTDTVVATVPLPGDVLGDEGSFITQNQTLNRAYLSKGLCAFSSCPPHPNVWVIDGHTNTVSTSFDTPSAPYNLAADPRTNRLYLGIDNTVWVMQDS